MPNRLRRLTMLFVLLLSASIAPDAALAQGAPPFTNGDMTLGDAVPEGWSLDWSGPGKVEAARDTTTFHSAPASLRISNSGGTAKGGVGYALDVSHRSFIVSGYVKGAGFGLKTAYVAVREFDASGKQLAWIDLTLVHGSSDWQPFAAKVVLPEKTASVKLDLCMGGEGSVWLDDLTVVPADGAAIGDIPLGVAPPDPESRPVLPKKDIVLFNGSDLAGFYTYLDKKELNKDPDHVFTVEGGAVHVSGKEFGYFATVVPYANYRVTFEMRWGEKKWPPRDGAKTQRDAGVLVDVFGPERVWPNSLECQIQENDFGDFFHLGGISSLMGGKRVNGRAVRRKPNEKPRGEWNTVEVICRGDSVTNSINGMVENEAVGVTRAREGKGGALNYGRIAFQSEGAEIWYRNIVVHPLD